MVNKNLKHNIDWKKTWNRMRAERMRPLKIEDAPLFKEKLFEDYLKNAKSNNYEYGRNIVNSLNNVLSENFKVLEIGPGPGTLTIPLARKVKKML
ncbi:MAG: class I SAM-dependent methyltransferase, partial [Actinomycetia bacterium]|nr:class I SAM-dependent methyltransferase [Actinomycetes bacterium]